GGPLRQRGGAAGRLLRAPDRRRGAARPAHPEGGHHRARPATACRATARRAAGSWRPRSPRPPRLAPAARRDAGADRRRARLVAGARALAGGVGTAPDRRTLVLGAGRPPAPRLARQEALAPAARRRLRRAAARPGARRRRFTGSREADYGAPNAFFVTQFLNDDPAPIDPATWRLRVTGRVGRPLSLGYADVQGDASLVATVDCTGGVYATREWRGLPVGALLDAAQHAPQATLVWFVSVTSYRWPLPLDEARRALVATHVGGEALSHAHGFPLRLVAPERRGFQWI